MVALALVFGSGPLCAATAQARVQTVSMECGDMPEAATAHIVMTHQTWRGPAIRASFRHPPSAPI